MTNPDTGKFRTDADRRLEEIRAEVLAKLAALKDAAPEVGHDGADWGHVGSLAAIDDLLGQALHTAEALVGPFTASEIRAHWPGLFDPKAAG